TNMALCDTRARYWSNARPWTRSNLDAWTVRARIHRVERWTSTCPSCYWRVSAVWCPQRLFKHVLSGADVKVEQCALSLEFDLQCLAWLSRATVKTYSANNVHHVAL